MSTKGLFDAVYGDKFRSIIKACRPVLADV